jgi:hypothetical protein
MDVSCDGLSDNADVGEGEVVCDDGAPAVGTEFDLRMGHRFTPVLHAVVSSKFIQGSLKNNRRSFDSPPPN